MASAVPAIIPSITGSSASKPEKKFGKARGADAKWSADGSNKVNFDDFSIKWKVQGPIQ